MHPCLRPELRAAQRVLRVVSNPYKASPRVVVRSFARFSRLREAARPTEGTTAPRNVFDPATTPVTVRSLQSKEKPVKLPHPVKLSINHFHHSDIRANTEDITWKSQSLADIPVPIPEFGESFEDLYTALKKFRAELDERDKLDHWQERDRRKSQDEKEIAHWLETGEVPAEHRMLEDSEDVPFHLRGLIGKFDFSTQLPCLYSDNPLRVAHWNPVCASLRHDQPQDLRVGNYLEHLKAEMRGDVPVVEGQSNSIDQSQNYHGSSSRRRKRLRDQKPTKSTTPLPQWFLDGNISRAGKSAPQGTEAVTITSSAGDPAPDDGQVQLVPKENAVEQQPEPRLTTYGKGRSGPSDDSPGDGSSPSKVPTSTIVNTKVLGDNRYFIDEAQYEELFNTFKGRLQSPSDTDPKHRVYAATNHLTILHGARDSELLFDALIRDMCNAVGANIIHIDAQDVTEFVTRAEKGKHNIDRAAKLSWKLYKSLYGTDEYQESALPRQEEEDNDDEEGDEDNEMPSFDIPIGAIGGKLPDIFKKLGQLRQNVGSMGMSPVAVISPIGSGANAFPSGFSSSNMLDTSVSYAPTVNAIMSSVLDQPSTEPVKETQESPSKPQPLVIHLENYKLLQEHPISEAFLATLIEVADDRRAAGQTVMVIGTDSLRDFSKASDPRSILENQASKSYGASTAIVLTPVFPNREAELALTEDRKTRIRNINARHLSQVLKGRGHLFHGLEDGFWRNDYKEAIGQRDHDALSTQFWSFVQIQRIAAVMAGIQSDAPLEDACSIIAASDESKVAWAQRNQPDLYKQEKKEETRSDDRQMRNIRSKASRHEKKLLSGVIEPKKISTTFEDIHIPVETVDALKMLTTLSLQRPEAFRYGVLKSDRIPGLLLYGPPGTGKTLAAKAVAKESGATMLEVSAADLNDMYVGEGEKNVQALFSLAKKLSPCVVFLDEADAMFSARSTSRRASHRELLNQFLKEWDGMSNDAGSAFIMVATNRPMDLDDAVLRRLPRRILVDLPTEADRLKILRIHLRNEDLDSTVDLDDLAKRTPFYSGSDLKNVAVAAALNAVRDENDAAAKSRSEKPNEKYEYPERRILTQKHFDKALDEITASISQDMSSLREIKKFDEQYGDRKGRKRKSPKWGFKSVAEADKVLDTVKVRS